MKKAAIIYASVHHGNTEKVVTAMAHDMPVTLFKAEQANNLSTCPLVNSLTKKSS